MMHSLIASCFVRLRWQLSRPFQTKVLPKWTPAVANVPGLKSLPYLTYGDLVMIAPLVFLLYAGYYYTFTALDVKEAGLMASIGVVTVFFTANKTNSIFTLLFGIPFERLIPFHRLAAFVTVVLGIFHPHAAWKREQSRGNNPTLSHFPFQDSTNRSGSFLTLGFILLVITSLSVFRRRAYDIWLATHIGLIIAVAVSCTVHAAIIGLIGVAWWLIDVIIRYMVRARCLYPTTATLRRLCSDVVEIRFPKPRHFQYQPGQFLRICIPALSAVQFHPLSISSAPYEEHVTLHAKALGDWTKRLLQLVEAEDSKEISMWLEGPYGNVSMDIDNDDRYRIVLCVSGGIGVTHCRSVARSILHDHQYQGRKLDLLRFVWSVRDPDLPKALLPFGEKLDQTKDATEGIPDLPVVQTEVYLSNNAKISSDEEEIAISNAEGQQFSGRPDFTKILTEMRDVALAKGLSHVAVFGCGPQSQVDSLKEECRRLSRSLTDSQGVYFDLHVDVFEF